MKIVGALLVGLATLLLLIGGSMIPTLALMFVFGVAASGRSDGAGAIIMIGLLPFAMLFIGYACLRGDKPPASVPSVPPRSRPRRSPRSYASRHT